MTTSPTTPSVSASSDSASSAASSPRPRREWARTNARWLLVAVAPPVLFGLFLLLAGLNPLDVYGQMLRSTLGDSYGLGEVVIKTTPFILTALAAALPARAGLINVGGEGQLAIGALFTAWAGVFYAPHLPTLLGFPLLLIAGLAGGALWAGVAGFCRVKGGMNETISTILLNYVALFTVAFFVHGALKDPASFNWPFSPQLPDSLRLPTLPGSRVHLGIVVAIAAAVLVWFVTAKTRWGFATRVVGGNPEAAKQAGLNVGAIQMWTLLAAGALAGLAGMIEVTGIEGRLRPTTGVGYGYLGFLASWMALNHPLWLVATAFIIGIISVGGNTLQISSGLPSSSVNILMALVLFAILAVGKKKGGKS